LTHLRNECTEDKEAKEDPGDLGGGHGIQAVLTTTRKGKLLVDLHGGASLPLLAPG
jgi:hypothetical protein